MRGVDVDVDGRETIFSSVYDVPSDKNVSLIRTTVPSALSFRDTRMDSIDWTGVCISISYSGTNSYRPMMDAVCCVRIGGISWRVW